MLLLLHCQGTTGHLLSLDPTAALQGRDPLRILGKPNISLISSILQAALPKAHWLLDGSLTDPAWRWSLPVINRVSGPVPRGAFGHSFPVRPSWASSTASLWNPAVPSEIWVDTAPLEWGISEHTLHQCPPETYP